MTPCPRGTTPYTVREGDTLWHIAQRSGTTVETIRNLNPVLDQRMLYIGQVICLPGPSLDHGDTVISEAGLSKYLRMLWEQHAAWTRLLIVSLVFGLPDAGAVTERLLRNPRDFAAALSPIYGGETAPELAGLLTSHLTIAADLVKAAKAKDTAAAASLEGQWYRNADNIAAFLHRTNPYWQEEEWRRLLYNHLRLTKQEAVDYLSGSYGSSIAAYDQIEKGVLEMADVMTRGIVDQFPGSFVA